MRGGAGNDRLTGGLGNDGFVFEEAPGEADSDLATDFTPGYDKLRLNDSAFAQIGAPGLFEGNDARFASGAGMVSGTDADHRIVYDTVTGSLYYDPDGAGPGSSAVFATCRARRPLPRKTSR